MSRNNIVFRKIIFHSYLAPPEFPAEPGRYSRHPIGLAARGPFPLGEAARPRTIPSPEPVSDLSQKYPDAAFRYAGPPFGRSVKLTPQMARISSPIGPTGVK